MEAAVLYVFMPDRPGVRLCGDGFLSRSTPMSITRRDETWLLDGCVASHRAFTGNMPPRIDPDQRVYWVLLRAWSQKIGGPTIHYRPELGDVPPARIIQQCIDNVSCQYGTILTSVARILWRDRVLEAVLLLLEKLQHIAVVDFHFLHAVRLWLLNLLCVKVTYALQAYAPSPKAAPQHAVWDTTPLMTRDALESALAQKVLHKRHLVVCQWPAMLAALLLSAYSSPIVEGLGGVFSDPGGAFNVACVLCGGDATRQFSRPPRPYRGITRELAVVRDRGGWWARDASVEDGSAVTLVGPEGVVTPPVHPALRGEKRVSDDTLVLWHEHIPTLAGRALLMRAWHLGLLSYDPNPRKRRPRKKKVVTAADREKMRQKRREQSARAKARREDDRRRATKLKAILDAPS